MAHRTLNESAKFFGDGREAADLKTKRNWPGKKKITGAQKAWSIQFPDKDWPHYAGSAYDAYEAIEEAGWKWSSRHGWRYMFREGDRVTITNTATQRKGRDDNLIAVFDPANGNTGKIVRVWVSNPTSGHRQKHYTVKVDAPNFGEFDFMYDDLVINNAPTPSPWDGDETAAD